MLGFAAWAVINGFIIGAVWVGIVLFRRHQRAEREEARLDDEVAGRQAHLEDVNQRIAELEARTDFTEQLLTRQRDQQVAPPGRADA